MVRLVPYSPSDRLTEVEAPDRELAEFKWSFGVVGGSVKLHESRWQRVTARFRKPTTEENRRGIEAALRLAGADAFIHVHAADDATLEIQLNLVNFSEAEILVESVGADYVSVASGSIQHGGPTMLPAIRTLAPKSVSGVTLRFPVLPAGIRTMASHIRDTQRRPSTPYANLHLRGALIVSRGSVRAAIPFQVHVPTPAIEWATSDILPTGQ